MSAKAKIALFSIVFCVLIALPFAANIGSASEQPEPSLDTPAINAMKDKKCVDDTEYMRTSHMKMLIEWRDEVVRSGNRYYTNEDGQVYEMSIDKTCLQCHSNPSEFCDSCHTYANVNISCWDCHDSFEEM
ncbi:sulfate reduction electron transfer complex DsrMKJOP subunit DsrJ [Curtanaerobium respiraculi]|uniref:sulfate reduction electron transfer complex DsrMKJOP subunit DsrJ n=1 Tax=Curtanaerobium respiraculi TaxID=2949669 RepID=UPI0024B3C846|nr:sulfate reduction electron transfer complex DsrMKJOP subunit DsrJ [Curtanaerobium respiraculi]